MFNPFAEPTLSNREKGMLVTTRAMVVNDAHVCHMLRTKPWTCNRLRTRHMVVLGS